MIGEVWQVLAGWSSLDTWIALTAALAAMACAIPGVLLVIRRQSMLGDALSHTALPGVVIALLAAVALRNAGWLSGAGYEASRHLLLFAGALALGVLTALASELIHKLGRVEASAALGVVFTSLFALGLLLLRLLADNVHIDPDCVLYGDVETIVFDTWPGTDMPRAAVVNGALLTFNALLAALFYKELRLAAFDPALATTLGFPAGAIHYAIVAATAATVVISFETVGSILVIAMLVAPAATALLLTDRLGWVFVVSVALAGLAALLGHVAAIAVTPVVFARLGYPSVVDASVAGLMAVAAGGLFVVALLLAPRHGLVSRWLGRLRLRWRLAGNELLGILYRREEEQLAGVALTADELAAAAHGVGPRAARWALWRLAREGLVTLFAGRYQLTDAGRRQGAQLVRAHRLWETFLAQRFDVADDHLHGSAARVEHYLDAELRRELADELSPSATDPHGRDIPDE